MTASKEKPAAPKAPAHTKEQLLRSERYRGKRDLLAALLQEGRQYTTGEVDGLVDKFMKGKVK